MPAAAHRRACLPATRLSLPLLTAFVCAGHFLYIPAASAQAADPAELERINAAIARVEADLAGMRTERSAANAELLASEKAIVELQEQMQAVRDEVTAVQAELAALRQQQQQLEASRVEQQALIASYLKTAWMAGKEEYLKLLLNQEDPRQTARMVRYYQAFSNARAARIAAWNETLGGLAVLAAGVAETTAALEKQQAQLKEQELVMEQNVQQRQQVLARLDSTLASRGEELEMLEQQKIEMEILLEELRRSITEIPLGADQQPFAARKGQLQWPLEGRLVNSFGARHSLGDLTWEGITIAAEAGADVQAIHHGRVVFADWFNSSGLLLIIDHGDGFMSLYAHNQELYKTVGEWVASGDIIAAAGNTGGQRETGLYFEIRRNGKAEDPVNWLSKGSE